MERTRTNRLKASLLLALGLVFVLTMVAYAEDPPFSGKWRGESRPAAAPGSGQTATGGGPAAAAGGAARGGARGGFGGGLGGPQKVSLNLKQSKDNKLSGNITIGQEETVDVKDGKADGNTISFKAGRSPQPIYEYKGELKGEELILTRNNPTGRGAATTEYVLSKK